MKRSFFYFSFIFIQTAVLEAALITGLDVVGCGYDVLSLQSKMCIVDTSKIGSSWSNPLYPELNYELPFGVFAMNKPESLELNGTIIMSSFQDFVMHSFWEVDEDHHGFLGFGSRHKHTETEKYFEKFYEHYYNLALSLRQITWYKLVIPTFPKPILSDLFKLTISSLPEAYNDATAPLFSQFIDSFGTHMVSEADFGGLVWAEDWFETCLLKTHDETWIREQVTKRYDPFGCFSNHHSSSDYQVHLAEDFQKYSENHTTLIGGTDSLTLDKWEEWIPSVKFNPKPITRKLIPIYNVLPEGAKKEALKQAIDAIRVNAANEVSKEISEMEGLRPAPLTHCPGFGSSNFKEVLKERIGILASNNNIEEARKQLCPIPGYHGLFCPGSNSARILMEAKLGANERLHLPVGVGLALDVTNGDLKLPVLDFSYDESSNKVWKDPITNQEFLIPKEIEVSQVDPAQNIPDVRIFKDEFELASVWTQATEKGIWLGGEFGTAKQLNSLYNLFFTGGQSTSISQLPTNIYKLTTTQTKLKQYAQYAIDSLPNELTNDYNDFLDAWGTHISFETQLGGMIEKQVVFKECIWSSPFFTGGMNDQQLTEAMQGELTGKQGDTYYVARRRISLDHRFGGSPENVADWPSTISRNPALLKINRLVPWSDVISDPTKKGNLLKAITDRVAKAKQARDIEYQQTKQSRAQALLAPRPAQGVVGHGRRGTIAPTFEIGGVVTLAGTAQCPTGLPRPQSLQQCNTGTYIRSWNRVELNEPLRYERDNEGKFRSVRCFDLDPATGNCLEHYGP